ncbi:MAG: ferrous iron transporter B [Oscillospiraceae bacterium]|nr:ferrous iron transporter B [Oscillospiraceae bacterium]
MSGYEIKPDEEVLKKPNKILLIGNPNVGKSIFFTELTGIHAISSNYAGTTVNFMEGTLSLGGEDYTLIDVPGTYSLNPTSEAETVAIRFLESGGKAVICVLDASNLERNLQLALELRRYKIPIVYTLNLVDVAKRQGVAVNAQLLAAELSAPVVETVAVKRVGLDALRQTLEDMLEGSAPLHQPCGNCPGCGRGGAEEIWESAKEITARVSSRGEAEPSFADKLSESMMRPMPGIPIALLVIGLVIAVVVGLGELLRGYLLEPLVDEVIVPFFRRIFTTVLPEGVVQDIMIGEFGVFVISFEWILALILPYVFLFYVVFTLLEDTGYLPRISVLFDNVMRKLGVQGGSLMYMLMGYGCAAPAIIGSRAATSRKERIVITAAICFAVPCISQSGALISLLAGYAWWMLPAMILFSFALFVAVTLVAGKLVKGQVDPLLIEVPNLLVPNPKSYFRKLLTRMKHFLKDAEVPMMIAILIAAILAESGLLRLLAVHAQPLVSGWLGLPADAVVALILGIVRREMSVAPLLALDLSALQAFVGGVVSLMYLPCLSVFAILAKEFHIRIALAITLSTIVLALFTGGVINQIGQLFA